MTDPVDQNARDDPKGNDATVDRERLLADALAEFLDRQARGENVDIEDFCQTHSNLEPELRLELRTAEEIEETLLPPQEPDRNEDT